jgi:hypothetical protein
LFILSIFELSRFRRVCNRRERKHNTKKYLIIKFSWHLRHLENLNYSRKNTLSTVQIIQIDQSPNTQQSRKNPNNSLTFGVKNGGVSRRRSARSVRYSRKSQTQTTPTAPSQCSRSGLDRNTMELIKNMDDDEKQYIDDLNTSSTSATTESMEMPQQHDNDHSIEAIDSRYIV